MIAGWFSPYAMKKRTPEELRFFSLSASQNDLQNHRKMLEMLIKNLRLFISHPKSFYGVAPTHTIKMRNFEKMKIWSFEGQKLGLMPWPGAPPPLLVRARAVERGAIFWQSHRSPMPLWNFRNGLRRPGPCCGASVGTTGSAPGAVACALVLVAGPLLEPPVPPLVRLPPLVRGLRYVRVRERTTENFLESWKKRLKFSPSWHDFSFEDRSRWKRQSQHENIMQIQQNSAKLDLPSHAETGRKNSANPAKPAKLSKTLTFPWHAKTGRKHSANPAKPTKKRKTQKIEPKNRTP